MNKEYIYMDGKVVVRDEKGNVRKIEYSDNLDKILIKENEIEKIQKRIQRLMKEKENYKAENFFPYFLLVSIGGVAITPFIFWMLTKMNPSIPQTPIASVFGPINPGILITIAFGMVYIPIGLYLSTIQYINYKHRKKIKKAIDSELEFLKTKLIEKQDSLESLKQEKQRNSEDTTFRLEKVNDTRELAALQNLSNVYYDLGYNDEKYYRYYQQGKLKERLQGKYSEEEIELAKKFLEEKGPTLVKKKKQPIRRV